MRQRWHSFWLLGLVLLAGIVVGGRYGIQMLSAARAKAAHVKQLRSITTIEEAQRAGWGWTPGATLLPRDCVHEVPNGGAIRGNTILDSHGNVIEKFDDCPVKGFGP